MLWARFVRRALQTLALLLYLRINFIKTKITPLDNTDFKKSFGLSLGVHVFIVSIFLIKFLFFTKPYIDLSQAIQINMSPAPATNQLPSQSLPVIEPAQQVTEKTIEEPKKASTVQLEATEKPLKNKIENKVENKKDEINIAKNKNLQKKAVDKLKKNSALEKIKQDLKNESISEIKQQVKQQANALAAVKALAAGSAITGIDKLQANTYLKEVDLTIKQHWSLPQWLINKPLKAQVLVKINSLGQVLSSKIISSSNNNSYDQYCLQAINKAAPFTKVPEKLTEKFSIDGIVIGFPE